jgi:NAD(P)-dependent dehydrogenase (short-subunit alcohol dehydrogenase family)
MSKVWLITGSARGLGRKIVEAVLAAGDRVVATARDPHQLDELVDRYGNQVRAVTLDVTDPVAARSAVQAALDAFWHLDVVVNNAGFGHLAPFEQVGDDDFRAQIDTNFYGVVNVTRAALPTLRQQGSGHIIQISSVGGRMGTPGLSAYQSAKWAVGGFTEVLYHEISPLGIKMTVLEPGGMRSDWGARAGKDIPVVLSDYAPTVGALADVLRRYVGKETSDPAKVAEVVVRLAYHDNPPLHLLLGSDAVYFSGEVDAARAASGKLWRAISVATDFDASEPIPTFPQ